MREFNILNYQLTIIINNQTSQKFPDVKAKTVMLQVLEWNM